MMRNKRNNFCIHERDYKRKIYVVFISFWGLRPQTPTGALPLEPRWGTSSSVPRPPQLCPQTSVTSALKALLLKRHNTEWSKIK